jgi:glycerol-3-phosphate dehydrogenase
VEDVLRRRTTVALKTSHRGAGAAELTAALMAEPLGWSQQIQENRAREYVEEVAPVPQSRRQA